jgi:hypothetical protein
MAVHIVVQGESLYTIAHAYGFLWETLWLHEGNASLRSQRENPEVLLPGDRIEIPKRTAKELSGATDTKHTFQKQGTLGLLRLCIETCGKPQGHLPFELSVGSWTHRGKTDSAGMLEVNIPPDAAYGVLVTRGSEGAVVRRLRLGHLDPADSERGALARLINLGFAEPRDRYAEDQRFDALLRGFQMLEQLSPTGKLDETTVAAVIRRHGS